MKRMKQEIRRKENKGRRKEIKGRSWEKKKNEAKSQYRKSNISKKKIK